MSTLRHHTITIGKKRIALHMKAELFAERRAELDTQHERRLVEKGWPTFRNGQGWSHKLKALKNAESP